MSFIGGFICGALFVCCFGVLLCVIGRNDTDETDQGEKDA